MTLRRTGNPWLFLRGGAVGVALVLCLPPSDLLAAPSARSIFSTKRPNHQAIRQRNEELLRQRQQIHEGHAASTVHGPQSTVRPTPLNLAVLQDLSAIAIPSEDGQVLEVWEKGTVPFSGSDQSGPKGDSPLFSAGGPVVVLLQDLHTQPDAQRAEARILEHLAKAYDLRLIASEGAWRSVDASFAKHLTDDTELRDLVAETFLEAGELTAEEHVAITKPYPLTIQGVEDETLYRRNLDTYHEVMAICDRAQPTLEGLRAACDALKPRLYGEEMLELDAHRVAFSRGEIPLANYLGYLTTLAASLGLPLSGMVPNLLRLQQLQATETLLNPSAAETQARWLISRLNETVSGGGSSTLAADLQTLTHQFRRRQLGAAGFYQRLIDLARRASVPLESCGDLVRFAEYLALMQACRVHQVHSELAVLEEALEDRLVRSEEERMLARLSRHASLLDDAFHLRLTTEQLAAFRQHRGALRVEVFEEFLAPCLKRYGLAANVDYSQRLIDDQFDTIERFYAIAESRDEAMAVNTLRLLETKASTVHSPPSTDIKINDRGLSTVDRGRHAATAMPAVALVAGGFHTEGMTALLRRQGIRYVVISPNASGELDEKRYRRLLAGERIDPASFTELAVRLRQQRRSALRLPLKLQTGSEGLLQTAVDTLAAAVRLEKPALVIDQAIRSVQALQPDAVYVDGNGSNVLFVRHGGTIWKLLPGELQRSVSEAEFAASARPLISDERGDAGSDPRGSAPGSRLRSPTPQLDRPLPYFSSSTANHTPTTNIPSSVALTLPTNQRLDEPERRNMYSPPKAAATTTTMRFFMSPLIKRFLDVVSSFSAIVVITLSRSMAAVKTAPHTVLVTARQHRRALAVAALAVVFFAGLLLFTPLGAQVGPWVAHSGSGAAWAWALTGAKPVVPAGVTEGETASLASRKVSGVRDQEGDRFSGSVYVAPVPHSQNKDSGAFPVEDGSEVTDAKAVGGDGATRDAARKPQGVGLAQVMFQLLHNTALDIGGQLQQLLLGLAGKVVVDHRPIFFRIVLLSTRPDRRAASSVASESGSFASASSASSSRASRLSTMASVPPVASIRRTIPLNGNGNLPVWAADSGTTFSSERPLSNSDEGIISSPPGEKHYSTFRNRPSSRVLARSPIATGVLLTAVLVAAVLAFTPLGAQVGPWVEALQQGDTQQAMLPFWLGSIRRWLASRRYPPAVRQTLERLAADQALSTQELEQLTGRLLSEQPSEPYIDSRILPAVVARYRGAPATGREEERRGLVAMLAAFPRSQSAEALLRIAVESAAAGERAAAIDALQSDTFRPLVDQVSFTAQGWWCWVVEQREDYPQAHGILTRLEEAARDGNADAAGAVARVYRTSAQQGLRDRAHQTLKSTLLQVHTGIHEAVSSELLPAVEAILQHPQPFSKADLTALDDAVELLKGYRTPTAAEGLLAVYLTLSTGDGEERNLASKAILPLTAHPFVIAQPAIQHIAEILMERYGALPATAPAEQRKRLLQALGQHPTVSGTQFLIGVAETLRTQPADAWNALASEPLLTDPSCAAVALPALVAAGRDWHPIVAALIRLSLAADRSEEAAETLDDLRADAAFRTGLDHLVLTRAEDGVVFAIITDVATADQARRFIERQRVLLNAQGAKKTATDETRKLLCLAGQLVRADTIDQERIDPQTLHKIQQFIKEHARFSSGREVTAPLSYGRDRFETDPIDNTLMADWHELDHVGTNLVGSSVRATDKFFCCLASLAFPDAMRWPTDTAEEARRQERERHEYRSLLDGVRATNTGVYIAAAGPLEGGLFWSQGAAQAQLEAIMQYAERYDPAVTLDWVHVYRSTRRWFEEQLRSGDEPSISELGAYILKHHVQPQIDPATSVVYRFEPRKDPNPYQDGYRIAIPEILFDESGTRIPRVVRQAEKLPLAGQPATSLPFRSPSVGPWLPTVGTSALVASIATFATRAALAGDGFNAVMLGLLVLSISIWFLGSRASRQAPRGTVANRRLRRDTIALVLAVAIGVALGLLLFANSPELSATQEALDLLAERPAPGAEWAMAGGGLGLFGRSGAPMSRRHFIGRLLIAVGALITGVAGLFWLLHRPAQAPRWLGPAELPEPTGKETWDDIQAIEAAWAREALDGTVLSAAEYAEIVQAVEHLYRDNAGGVIWQQQPSLVVFSVFGDKSLERMGADGVDEARGEVFDSDYVVGFAANVRDQLKVRIQLLHRHLVWLLSKADSTGVRRGMVVVALRKLLEDRIRSGDAAIAAAKELEERDGESVPPALVAYIEQTDRDVVEAASLVLDSWRRAEPDSALRGRLGSTHGAISNALHGAPGLSAWSGRYREFRRWLDGQEERLRPQPPAPLKDRDDKPIIHLVDTGTSGPITGATATTAAVNRRAALGMLVGSLPLVAIALVFWYTAAGDAHLAAVGVDAAWDWAAQPDALQHLGPLGAPVGSWVANSGSGAAAMTLPGLNALPHEREGRRAQLQKVLGRWVVVGLAIGFTAMGGLGETSVAAPSVRSDTEAPVEVSGGRGDAAPISSPRKSPILSEESRAKKTPASHSPRPLPSFRSFSGSSTNPVTIDATKIAANATRKGIDNSWKNAVAKAAAAWTLLKSMSVRASSDLRRSLNRIVTTVTRTLAPVNPAPIVLTLVALGGLLLLTLHGALVAVGLDAAWDWAAQPDALQPLGTLTGAMVLPSLDQFSKMTVRGVPIQKVLRPVPPEFDTLLQRNHPVRVAFFGSDRDDTLQQPGSGPLSEPILTWIGDSLEHTDARWLVISGSGVENPMRQVPSDHDMGTLTLDPLEDMFLDRHLEGAASKRFQLFGVNGQQVIRFGSRGIRQLSANRDVQTFTSEAQVLTMKSWLQTFVQEYKYGDENPSADDRAPWLEKIKAAKTPDALVQIAQALGGQWKESGLELHPRGVDPQTGEMTPEDPGILAVHLRRDGGLNWLTQMMGEAFDREARPSLPTTLKPTIVGAMHVTVTFSAKHEVMLKEFQRIASELPEDAIVVLLGDNPTSDDFWELMSKQFGRPALKVMVGPEELLAKARSSDLLDFSGLGVSGSACVIQALVQAERDGTSFREVPIFYSHTSGTMFSIADVERETACPWEVLRAASVQDAAGSGETGRSFEARWQRQRSRLGLGSTLVAAALAVGSFLLVLRFVPDNPDLRDPLSLLIPVIVAVGVRGGCAWVLRWLVARRQAAAVVGAVAKAVADDAKTDEALTNRILAEERVAYAVHALNADRSTARRDAAVTGAFQRLERRGRITDGEPVKRVLRLLFPSLILAALVVMLSPDAAHEEVLKTATQLSAAPPMIPALTTQHRGLAVAPVQQALRALLEQARAAAARYTVLDRMVQSVDLAWHRPDHGHVYVEARLRVVNEQGQWMDTPLVASADLNTPGARLEDDAAFEVLARAAVQGGWRLDPVALKAEGLPNGWTVEGALDPNRTIVISMPVEALEGSAIDQSTEALIGRFTDATEYVCGLAEGTRSGGEKPQRGPVVVQGATLIAVLRGLQWRGVSNVTQLNWEYEPKVFAPGADNAILEHPLTVEKALLLAEESWEAEERLIGVVTADRRIALILVPLGEEDESGAAWDQAVAAYVGYAGLATPEQAATVRQRRLFASDRPDAVPPVIPADRDALKGLRPQQRNAVMEYLLLRAVGLAGIPKEQLFEGIVRSLADRSEGRPKGFELGEVQSILVRDVLSHPIAKTPSVVVQVAVRVRQDVHQVFFLYDLAREASEPLDEQRLGTLGQDDRNYADMAALAYRPQALRAFFGRWRDGAIGYFAHLVEAVVQRGVGLRISSDGDRLLVEPIGGKTLEPGDAHLLETVRQELAVVQRGLAVHSLRLGEAVMYSGTPLETIEERLWDAVDRTAPLGTNVSERSQHMQGLVDRVLELAPVIDTLDLEYGRIPDAVRIPLVQIDRSIRQGFLSDDAHRASLAFLFLYYESHLLPLLILAGRCGCRQLIEALISYRNAATAMKPTRRPWPLVQGQTSEISQEHTTKRAVRNVLMGCYTLIDMYRVARAPQPEVSTILQWLEGAGVPRPDVAPIRREMTGQRAETEGLFDEVARRFDPAFFHEWYRANRDAVLRFFAGAERPLSNKAVVAIEAAVTYAAAAFAKTREQTDPQDVAKNEVLQTARALIQLEDQAAVQAKVDAEVAKADAVLVNDGHPGFREWWLKHQETLLGLSVVMSVAALFLLVPQLMEWVNGKADLPITLAEPGGSAVLEAATRTATAAPDATQTVGPLTGAMASVPTWTTPDGERVTEREQLTPLKVAVIGTGGFGRYHVGNLLEEAKALGVPVQVQGLASAGTIERLRTDTYLSSDDGGRRQPFYDQVRWTDRGTTDDDLFRALEPGTQAVCIATPAKTHYALAKQALERGLHVLVEKPMTLMVEQAEELVELAKQRNLILMAGHLHLHAPHFRLLQEMIADGNLGPIQRIDSALLTASENPDTVVQNLGIHILYMVRRLLEVPDGQEAGILSVEDLSRTRPTGKGTVRAEVRYVSRHGQVPVTVDVSHEVSNAEQKKMREASNPPRRVRVVGKRFTATYDFTGEGVLSVAMTDPQSSDPELLKQLQEQLQQLRMRIEQLGLRPSPGPLGLQISAFLSAVRAAQAGTPAHEIELIGSGYSALPPIRDMVHLDKALAAQQVVGTVVSEVVRPGRRWNRTIKQTVQERHADALSQLEQVDTDQKLALVTSALDPYRATLSRRQLQRVLTILGSLLGVALLAMFVFDPVFLKETELAATAVLLPALRARTNGGLTSGSIRVGTAEVSAEEVAVLLQRPRWEGAAIPTLSRPEIVNIVKEFKAERWIGQLVVRVDEQDRAILGVLGVTPEVIADLRLLGVEFVERTPVVASTRTKPSDVRPVAQLAPYLVPVTFLYSPQAELHQTVHSHLQRLRANGATLMPLETASSVNLDRMIEQGGVIFVVNEITDLGDLAKVPGIEALVLDAATIKEWAARWGDDAMIRGLNTEFTLERLRRGLQVLQAV